MNRPSPLLPACILACAVPLAVQSAAAADFDGSKPLICATVEAHDCAAEDTCEYGTPGQLGLPQFLRLNVKEKTIQGTQRTTAIKIIEETDTQLLMMGTELGAGWTMALDRDTGAMVISMATSSGAAVLFGACTPL